MRLKLKGPGGFGGLQIEGQLDTDELSLDLARRVKELLQSEALRHVKPSGTEQMTDPECYDLTLVEEGRAQEFHLQSSGTPVEVMVLLGDLMHEVIARKAKALGK